MTRNIFIAYESAEERARIPETARDHEKYDAGSIHNDLRLYHCPVQLIRQYSDERNIHVIRLNDLPLGLDIETHIRKDPELNPRKEMIPKAVIKTLIKSLGACFTELVGYVLKTLVD